MSMKFRTDINALRALAVLSVLFFHFHVPGFSGGYVGVDVFFVISGFLMTKIIMGEKFGLLKFYTARARRIMPALFGVTATTLLLGWFFVPPTDYKELAHHIYAALNFTSNNYFANKTGYFDAAAEKSAMLHTWSLSVEWQFYLLFPLLMMALKKRTKWLIPLAIASLALSAWWMEAKPEHAFFALPPRAWELLAGSFVFLYGRNFKYAFEIGITLILLPIFFYTHATPFPGLAAVPPVLGAALVLSAQRRNKWLDHPVAHFFGEISYSLYLWHWPVKIAAAYYELPIPAWGLIALSILLGSASYFLIEKPTRKNAPAALLLFYVALYAGAFYVAKHHGIPQRVDEAVRAAELEGRVDRHYDFTYKNKDGIPHTLIGDETKTPSIAVWGDSHASAEGEGFANLFKQRGISGLIYAYAGCPPVQDGIFPNHAKRRYRCAAVNKLTQEEILKNTDIKTVILAVRWPLYLHGGNEQAVNPPLIQFADGKDYPAHIVSSVCTLAKKKRVILLANPPELGRSVPGELSKSRMIHHRETEVTLPRASHEERMKEVMDALKTAEKQCGATLIDPTPLFCDKTSCRGVEKGLPLYVDDNHLSIYGFEKLKPALTRIISQTR